MRLKGEIVKDRGLSVIFLVGGRRVPVPKSGIKRLEPNNFCLGPHTISIERRLAERLFGSARRKAPAAQPEAGPDG